MDDIKKIAGYAIIITMNFLFPILAAALEASAMTLDKVALSIQKLSYKSYLGINFPLVTLVLLVVFLIIRPPISSALFAGKLPLLILLCALISFAVNLLYYRALSKDNLNELQIVDLLFGLPTALYASIFFVDERKPIILGMIILVSIVIVWSHWEKHHFKIAKRTSYYLIWIVTIAPFSPLAIKELLVVWHPVALTAIISAITTLLLAPIYLKYAPRTSPKAFLTLLVISIFNGLATIFYYFSYQVSGIALTMLLFSLQPILVYFASVFFLKERLHWKKLTAFIIILISIAIIQITAPK